MNRTLTLKRVYCFQVQKVTQRIVCAIEEPDQERRIVSAVYKIWPPPEPVSDTGSDLHLNQEMEHIRATYPPSARAVGSVVEMPYLPESSNPNKVFESTDWKLYIVDLVSSCFQFFSSFHTVWPVVRSIGQDH